MRACFLTKIIVNTQDSTIVKSGTCFIVLSAYSQCVGRYVRYIRETAKWIRKYRIELKKKWKVSETIGMRNRNRDVFRRFFPFPVNFRSKNTMPDRRVQLRSRRFPADAITRPPQTLRTFPRTTLYVHSRRGHTFAPSESALLARNNISFSNLFPRRSEISQKINSIK